MSDHTAVMRQALEALVHMTGVLNAAGWATGHADAAVKALRAALAEQPAPAAEQAVPVAWPFRCGHRKLVRRGHAQGLLREIAAWMRRDGVGDCEAIELVSAYIDAIEAAPPAPARQPSPSLTVGMLMEAGLMVGSTPDSVGTSNWAVRMLGALRALAVDQPDAPPAPAAVEQAEPVEVRDLISRTIGFGFEVGELQTVNADDLLRLAAALCAAPPTPAQGGRNV